MKFFLMVAINIYWLCWPTNWRRTCLYRESCSRHVYRITNNKGFIAGLTAFMKRYRKCRADYSVIIRDDHFQLRLSDDSVLNEGDISKELLTAFDQSVSKSKFQVSKQISKELANTI